MHIGKYVKLAIISYFSDYFRELIQAGNLCYNCLLLL